MHIHQYPYLTSKVHRNSKEHLPNYVLTPELKKNWMKKNLNIWKAYGKIIQVGVALNAQSFLICQMQ